MLLHKIKPVGLFLVGFFAGSGAVAFVFGLLFFANASGSITAAWLSNATLVRGITYLAGLLCGLALAWWYPK